MGDSVVHQHRRRTLAQFVINLVFIFVIVVCIGSGSVASAESDPVAGLIEQAKRATVAILKGEGQDDPTEEFGEPVSVRGTGIHIGQGFILTVRHAVERTQGGKQVVPEVIHILTDDLRELPAVRKGANSYLDVALYQLSVPEPDWPQASVVLADRPVTYGDAVFTVGFPLGWGPAINYGKVGNPNTFLPTLPSRLIQVDMSVCQGNSGGGLLDQQGRLVGLVHAIIQTEMKQEDRRCSRFTFALPGLLVKRVATALKEGRTPAFSVLGLQVEIVSSEGGRALRVEKVSGPSRHAGFRKGDMLSAINDIPITSSAQLKNYLIEQTEPGQTVKISVRRDDQQKEIEVVLGGS